LEKALVVAGKKNFKIDSQIGFLYVFRLCWKYGWMLIRGFVFSIGHSRISKSIYVGRKVKVIEKRYLTFGNKSRLEEGVYIDALSKSGVIIGSNVIIGRNSRIECTGGIQKIGKGIKIGDKSTFGNDCFFGAAGGIDIGNDVIAGQFIRFHSENHNYNDLSIPIREQGVSNKGIKIGDNCWIGAGAVFLDGAELGNGCVVGANSVVTKKFPDNSIIAGIPAKLIKKRGDN